MKKFGIDNPFFNFMSRIGDILILNILFFLTCIPVVTIGTACTAMYRVTLRMARQKSNYVAKEYFCVFREEWKKSTVLWIILFVTGAVLVFDVFAAGEMWAALNVAVGALILIWSFLFTYTFPLQAQFENTVKNTLKNAFMMSVCHLPSTIVMVLLNALPVICILLGTTVMAMATPIYVTVGFALTARLNSFFLVRIFGKYMTEDGEGDEGISEPQQASIQRQD